MLATEVRWLRVESRTVLQPPPPPPKVVAVGEIRPMLPEFAYYMYLKGT